MKGRKRGLKWLLAFVGLFLLALVTIVLTYPYWLPYAARPVAKRFGVTFQKYERVKDGRFVLTDIVRTNRFFDLKISRVEGFLPHVWRGKVGETNLAANFLEVNGWRVVIHDRAQKDRRDEKPSRPKRSVYEHWKRVEDYIAQARKFVPRATFLNGIIEHGDKEYTFSVITWDKGLLDASGIYPVSAVPIEIKGKLTGEPPYQLSYAMHPLDFRTRLRVVETNGLLNAQVATFYKESKLDLVANFGREGMLPLTANLKAPSFKLPGELLKLDKYSEVSGSLSGEWFTNYYTVEVKAHAEPLASVTNMPAGDLELVARGDTNSVHVEKAVSTIPGLQLVVSDPIEISYRGRMLSERAVIQVDAELDKIPRLKLNGRIQGKILLEKGDPFPTATFQAAGTDLGGFRIQTENVEVAGKLNWPKLEEFSGTVRFASNSVVEAMGAADLNERTLAETVIRAEGPLLANLLPAGIHFGNLKLSAKVSGGLTNLQHGGQFELRDFVAPQLQPVTIEASWKAEQFTFDQLSVRTRAGPTAIFVSGAGYAGAGRTNFVVRDLKFFKGDETYLSLAEPSWITLTTNVAGPELELRPMLLVGTNRQAFVSGGFAWPKMASLDFRATNVNPALFQSFTTRSLGGVDFDAFNVRLGWSNGPITGEVSGRVSAEVEQFERLTAAVDLELETNRISLRQFSILNPGAEICRASGFLPVSLDPLSDRKLRISTTDPIDFEAETAPNEAFWGTISKLSKLNISNAAVRVQVRGTTREPTGELQVKAAGLGLARTNRLPAIGPFEGRVVLNPQEFSIPEFSARVEDQPVSISGRMPLGENFWTQRREEVLQYVLDHATVHVRAPDVNLAPFTEQLPNHLRAQGKLVADVMMEPGRKFSGRVEVRDVETRPLPKIGVVQEITADVVLSGKTVQIENLSGVFGGETLSIGGKVDLSAESVAKGYPNLDFSIKGYNVPLARNPDVILRSDLDLQVKNGTNRIPVISGTATLRDSFLLRDIATLVPGRVARPEMRPPYFTLSQDPIDEWTLDIRVSGNDFMRVRSPFFMGTVSANFRVGGTLQEPMALGDASMDSGRIIFPFASLDIKQALVSLTSEDPYLPQVFAVASGRAFGFDIRMQAEGPADEPILQFTSVPPLTSEQISLMLTTGQIPREDFGFSKEDRASKLALFLGKSLWSKLNPNQPAEERLMIRSGQDVTESGRTTYEVEYKLTDRWSLVGEYNRFGDLIGNVKWKVFSR